MQKITKIHQEKENLNPKISRRILLNNQIESYVSFKFFNFNIFSKDDYLQIIRERDTLYADQIIEQNYKDSSNAKFQKKQIISKDNLL